MLETTYKFPKSERLCGEIRIGELFKSGNAYMAYPYRVVYSLVPKTELKHQPMVQVLMNVPKKRHKRAVKRNRIKRLMRESYRLNKHSLFDYFDDSEHRLQIAFNYVSDEELDFEYMNKRMKLAFNKLIEELMK